MPENKSLLSVETPETAPDSPVALFLNWYEKACETELANPNAMCLSTVTENGRPDSRVVLMKDIDDNGIVFYTNLESRKSKQLKRRPHAALNFYWKSLARQVRITGAAELIDEKTADAYFQSRPRGSQIGAWASRQSRPLDKREDLEKRVEDYAQTFKDEDKPVPRPDFWSGFRVIPERYEFWCNEEHRLHYRMEYLKTGDGWTKQLLYP